YEAAPKAPTILVQRRKDGRTESWKRLSPREPVFTSEPLVSLPGYASEIRLNNGLRLLLRGNVPEFSIHPLMDLILDCALVLDKSAEVDLDLTLQRGRLYVTNNKAAEKGPAKVRVRFNDEVWDLTLEPNTEVGIDLLKQYSRDSNWKDGEEPRAEVYL